MGESSVIRYYFKIISLSLSVSSLKTGHLNSGLGVRDSISTRPYDPLSNRGQEVAVDGRGTRLRVSNNYYSQYYRLPACFSP